MPQPLASPLQGRRERGVRTLIIAEKADKRGFINT